MLDPKKPVNATRREKKKKAGGPVQRANVKKPAPPVQLTVQRTKQKNANGPAKLTKVIASSRPSLPSPNTQVKQPRHCHCCSAYRKAMRKGKPTENRKRFVGWKHRWRIRKRGVNSTL